MRIHKFTRIIDLDKDNTFNRDEDDVRLWPWWPKRVCDHGFDPQTCDVDDCRLARQERLDANPFTRPWPTLGQSRLKPNGGLEQPEPYREIKPRFVMWAPGRGDKGWMD